MSISLQLIDKQLIIENFNNDFLLIKSTKKASLAALGKSIFEANFDFVEEVIVTEVELCLKLNQHFKEEKIELLKNLKTSEISLSKTYKLPVFFQDHEDWKAIEKHTNLTKNELIEKLLKLEFSIAMFGFLPGFVYLNGLEKSLQIPRKKVPSKYVEANSLAIGGQYLGIYSLPSPGGWHVIGKLPISVLELPNVPPVSLNLGDKVKLQSIEKKLYLRLLEQPISLEDYQK